MLHDLQCRLLCANPLIAVADGFLDSAACQQMMDVAAGRLERAAVMTDDADAAVSDERTNSECLLDPEHAPEILPCLERLSRIVGLPVSHSEGLSVLKYAPTQEFKTHADGIWSGAAPQAVAGFRADGGQRLFTTMIYLNRVPDGGETSFPWLKFQIAPEQGRLLIFANTAAGDDDQSKLAAHAGKPVIAGEKWVAVTWWRQLPYVPHQTD